MKSLQNGNYISLTKNKMGKSELYQYQFLIPNNNGLFDKWMMCVMTSEIESITRFFTQRVKRVRLMNTTATLLLYWSGCRGKCNPSPKRDSFVVKTNKYNKSYTCISFSIFDRQRLSEIVAMIYLPENTIRVIKNILQYSADS